MVEFLQGAIAMASVAAAILFLSFHRSTRDRFFLYLVASFTLDAVCRAWLVFWQLPDSASAVYILRIVAYGLIVAAIVDKNLFGRAVPIDHDDA